VSLTTYADIKEELQDELDELLESPYPEDYLHQLAETCTPDRYFEIVEQWSDMPMEHSDQWRELNIDPRTNIAGRMKIDLYLYYRALYLEVFEDLKHERETD
jgi:hypothetical protein